MNRTSRRRFGGQTILDSWQSNAGLIRGTSCGVRYVWVTVVGRRRVIYCVEFEKAYLLSIGVAKQTTFSVMRALALSVAARKVNVTLLAY